MFCGIDVLLMGGCGVHAHMYGCRVRQKSDYLFKKRGIKDTMAITALKPSLSKASLVGPFFFGCSCRIFAKNRGINAVRGFNH